MSRSVAPRFNPSSASVHLTCVVDPPQGKPTGICARTPIEPITANLEMAIGSGHQALEKTQDTLDLVNDLLSPESPLQYRFIELAEELAETARSIRILVDLLERDPNSIIFDKDSSGE